MAENFKSSGMTNEGAMGVYDYFFNGCRDGTVYYDPSQKTDFKSLSDMREDLGKNFYNRQEQLKAETISGMGTGTAGYSMIPVYVDPRIVDRSRKFTPWTELIQRVTNMGITADYNYISAKGSGKFHSEDDSLADVSDTEARGSKAIKYLYSVGRTTGQVVAAMPPYTISGLQPSGDGVRNTTFGSPNALNGKQKEVLVRAQALKELEENAIWMGNSTTSGTSTGSANGTEFDGIVAQQSTTNQEDLSSTSLAWEDIDITVEYAYTDGGRPTMAGCDSSSLRDIRKLVFSQYRYPAQKDKVLEDRLGVSSGITLETLTGAVSVVPTQYLSTTTGAKQVFFLDMEYIEMRVLQDMTYETLAKSNDSEKFMLKMYETLLLTAPAFNAFIDNIA